MPEKRDPWIVRRGAARESPRVLIIWPHVPSYFAACVKSLLRDWKVQVFLIVDGKDHQPNHLDLLSSSGFQFLGPPDVCSDREAEIAAAIDDFHPDVLLASCRKWGLRSRLMRRAMSHKPLAIWAADNYWRGSLRDYGNLLLSRLRLFYSLFDAVWVPGTLGREYARKMGFGERRIFEGIYSCDASAFQSVGERRFGCPEGIAWPNRFLFVGQYIARKNVATLVEAYRIYRAGVADPWELWCAGRGPLKALLQNQPGIVDWGYQDARSCADLMSEAGIFVLPSWVDHWPLVVHEATSAGLPILASHGIGSTAELVREGYNGYTFPPGDAEVLALLMQRLSQNANLVQFGWNSRKMSCQFSPELWCLKLMQDIPSMVGELQRSRDKR